MNPSIDPPSQSPSHRTIIPSLTPITPATVSTTTSFPPPSTSILSIHTQPTTDAASQESGSSLRSRISLSSPIRPRLDPQYAARLAPTYRSTPPPKNSQSASSLMLPPTINRESNKSSIFRPTPMVTPSRTITERVHSTGSESLLNTPERSMRSSSYNSLSPLSRMASFGSLTTPMANPRRFTTRFRSDIGQSDRFIPSRATSNLNYSLWEAPSRSRSSNSSHSDAGSDGGNNSGDERNQQEESTTEQASTGRNSDSSSSSSSNNLFNVLLRSELLGENMDPSHSHHQFMTNDPRQRVPTSIPLREGGNHLMFTSPRQAYHETVFDQVAARTSVVENFSLTPVGSAASQRLLSTPQAKKRRIQKVPFKVLDAPALQDDFYLNLVDWSSQNELAVGLGSCVYLWSACTSKVTKLCDLASADDIVTSVGWAQRGSHLAVGTNKGDVQLWDTVKCKKIRTMTGHSARIGTLSWCGPTLASGSRDRLIYIRDVRMQSQYTTRLCSHKQEVCGLKWSFDEPAMLASGGNDNKLLVWDIKNHTQPVHRFAEHTAAVKAIAWSPHQHGLLASGGGTADRCIRFWNTLSGVSLNTIDTGSQVCNLAWSQNCNEIVSTHGYSLNQIVVWRYPSMSKVVTLTGHTYRVLYLAMSPDGSTIVTGAGDETLRFWQVFPGPHSHDKNNANGLLFPALPGSVVR